MAIDLMQTLGVIEALENFLYKRRPPETLRDQIDISYKIENQSVIIFEIRPCWDNPKEIKEYAIAKTTFVKTKQHWNVYWVGAKWHIYAPKPFVKTIKEFTELVEEDKQHCFWG